MVEVKPVPPRCRRGSRASTARLPGSVRPKESEQPNVFPSEGSWKVFSVFKVPMAAVGVWHTVGHGVI